MSTTTPSLPAVRGAHRAWPDHAAVRRWHFYAGLLCLPFFCWLAITGSVYLFRPDIEAWLDQPYEGRPLEGPRRAPSAEARAAVAAVPGSTFSHYEPPATATGAAQVLVLRDGLLFRVYVDPATLQPMKIVQDDHRPMAVLANLHGQLLLGSGGSLVVETAGCWGVVMILTGLYLWLPRGQLQWGGVLYPRLGRQGRTFWRDLHAVAGLWISLVTLLLLLSGLPWSSAWGTYLTWARGHWAATQGKPDWPIGGMDPPTVSSSDLAAADSMPGMSGAEMAAMAPAAHAPHEGQAGGPGPDLRPLDTMVALSARLPVPRPLWISPPARGLMDWTISSHVQNRPRRVTYTVDPANGTVTGRTGFGDQNIVDQVVNVAIASHEGQLFGRINQAILLLNAAGLLLVAISAVTMWWRRRPASSLGAPLAAARPVFSCLLAVLIVVLAVLLPMFGLSLLVVLAIERAVLRKLPRTRDWLGLAQRGA